MSAPGLKRTAFDLMVNENTPSVLREFTFNQLTSKDIFIAAQSGDKLANAAFETTGKILGEALADLVAITTPEAIFLYGGLAKSKKLILR